MSKGPDLSAFPIPRKGGARPIALDEATEAAAGMPPKAEGTDVLLAPPAPAGAAARPAAIAEAERALPRPAQAAPPAAAVAGQIVATTVKLDASRYLRLAEAGKPGPGRLKRRSIQEMVIEALDEWFERRGL